MANQKLSNKAIIGFSLTICSILVAVSFGLFNYWHSTNAPKHLDIITQEDPDHLQNMTGLPHFALNLDNNTYDNPSTDLAMIHNSGNIPIQPTDFVEPLQVQVNKPWKIIAVIDVPGVKHWNYSLTHLAWKAVDDQTWVAEKFLINPDEYSIAALYLSNPETSGTPEIHWSVRIVNLPEISERRLTPDQSKIDIQGPFVFLLGQEILIVLCIFALFQATYCFLLARRGNLKWGLRSVLLITLCSVVSICAAESVTCYAFVNPIYTLVYSVQPYMHHLANGPPIVVHLALMIFLLCSKKRLKKTKQQPATALAKK